MIKYPAGSVFIILAFAFCFSGCESSPRPVPGEKYGPPYAWGNYEEQVYAHLNKGSLETQIMSLESDLRVIVAGGKFAPPGLFAQLGLLYAEAGNRETAISFFLAEKDLYPEAAAFMDFLIGRLGG